MLARKVTEADELLGQRIRIRRMERHISQEKLGRVLGVTFQQVQKYELGVNRVSGVRLKHIADALEVDIADLTDGIGDDKKYDASPLAAFMASKDGLDIAEAMMQLDAHLRRSVIELARRLSVIGQSRA
jgi:transcriptional regulator with XRE-family HTH domain